MYPFHTSPFLSIRCFRSYIYNMIIEEYIHDVNVQILLERYAHFEIIGISILQLQFPKENKHIPCCIFSLALYIKTVHYSTDYLSEDL